MAFAVIQRNTIMSDTTNSKKRKAEAVDNIKKVIAVSELNENMVELLRRKEVVMEELEVNNKKEIEELKEILKKRDREISSLKNELDNTNYCLKEKSAAYNQWLDEKDEVIKLMDERILKLKGKIRECKCRKPYIY